MIINLSPYEKDHIIPNSFGLTEMGRDLLGQDYMLKQITASLIYPEEQLGRRFWDKVYTEAQAKYGTTNIPVNTFNKVWIIPEKAVVYENGTTAYITETKLKVMLEQDYLALERNTSQTIIPKQTIIQNNKDINTIGSQIIREIIIPQLENEVNKGKNFSQLRQVYHSLVLANWYKKRLKDSILSEVYTDKNKIGTLLSLNALWNPAAIYQRYLQAFKKGVFNFIREEQDLIKNQVIPRKYFSGGFSLDHAQSADEYHLSSNPIGNYATNRDLAITADLKLTPPQN